MNRRLLLTYCAAALVAASIALVVKSSWPGREKSGPGGGGAVPKVVVLDPSKPDHQAALEEYRQAQRDYEMLQKDNEIKINAVVTAFNRVVEEELDVDIAEWLKFGTDDRSLDVLKTKVAQAKKEFEKKGHQTVARQKETIAQKVEGWNDEIKKIGELETILDAIKNQGALEFWEEGQDRKKYGFEWVWVSDGLKKIGGGFWVSKSEIRITQATDHKIELPKSHAGFDELKKKLEQQAIPIPQPNIAALQNKAAQAVARNNWAMVMQNEGLRVYRDEVQAKANALIKAERERLQEEANEGRLKPLEKFPRDRECVTAARAEDAQGFVMAASGEFGGSPPWRFRLPSEAEWKIYQKLTDKLDGIGKSDFSEWVIASDGSFKVVDKNWKGEPTNPPAPGTASFRLVFAAD